VRIKGTIRGTMPVAAANGFIPMTGSVYLKVDLEIDGYRLAQFLTPPLTLPVPSSGNTVSFPSTPPVEIRWTCAAPNDSDATGHKG
jgi:hypothetical protein